MSGNNYDIRKCGIKMEHPTSLLSKCKMSKENKKPWYRNFLTDLSKTYRQNTELHLRYKHKCTTKLY